MKKKPQRFRTRAEEPTVNAQLGPPPEDWVRRAETSPENRKLVEAWNKLAALLALVENSVVTAADEILVAMACRCMVKVEGGYAKSGDVKELRSLLAELGLTPSGRARQQGPARTGDPSDGDFGEFVRNPARHSA
jgi:phage terminase small subunit